MSRIATLAPGAAMSPTAGTASIPTETAAPVPRLWWSSTAWVSFGASFFTAFTLPFVGELPAGEILLVATALWALVSAAINQAWPGPLFAQRLLWRLLSAQLVALVAYIASDFYRHSTTHDMARGWGRMILLGVDLVAIAFLFGRSPANLVIFVVGGALGDVVNALVNGPLFGDMWKFGVGAPISYGVFLLAPLLGPFATALSAGVIGVVHFTLDYRSFGGLCLGAGVVSLLQRTRPSFRLWLAPFGIAIVLAGCWWFYQQPTQSHRTTRSDVERSAMFTAALDAVQESPLIGHGSWFSNSDVYDHFMRIRFARAREAHVGGFADPNKRPDAMALHSQILVAVAEGGLFGGAFFIVFGAALIWTLCNLVFAQPWYRLAPLYTLLLLSAFWNLCFSPFSGAQRVYIATACGLMLLLRSAADDAPESQPTTAEMAHDWEIRATQPARRGSHFAA